MYLPIRDDGCTEAVHHPLQATQREQDGVTTRNDFRTCSAEWPRTSKTVPSLAAEGMTTEHLYCRSSSSNVRLHAAVLRSSGTHMSRHRVPHLGSRTRTRAASAHTTCSSLASCLIRQATSMCPMRVSSPPPSTSNSADSPRLSDPTNGMLVPLCRAKDREQTASNFKRSTVETRKAVDDVQLRNEREAHTPHSRSRQPCQIFTT
jgi:hypothetical protein